MMNYHNGHRLFLQTFISRKCLSEKEAKNLSIKVGTACGENANTDEFEEFLHIINKQLESIFMEIRRGRSEDTGQTFFILVNTVEDEHAKLATEFTPLEIEYVKKVIHLIVESEEGFVSTMDLVNCGLDLTKKVSSQMAEGILEKLYAQGWLTEKQGDAFFAVRAIVELGQYLRNIYNEEIPECPLCHDFVNMGDICLHCNVVLHKFCASTNFYTMEATKRKCPKCKELWTNDVSNISSSTRNDVTTKNANMETSQSTTREIEVIPSQTGKRSSRQRSARK